MTAKLKDGLWIGDAQSAQDHDFIDKQCITYFINCAGHQIPNFNEDRCPHMTFFWDDEDDFQLFDKQGVVVEQIVSFIDEALLKGETVLIYSMQGISRCTACASAYLMAKYEWGMDKCMEFIYFQGRCMAEMRPNDGFLMQLANLDWVLQVRHVTPCVRATRFTVTNVV
mmetsp:Transcript_38775/g.89354  ORF Transcript_38775/g.89354 Transcript_38775/m.89354 type:complete len:169 (+) Transcript_38775:45-551(+)